MFYRDALAQFLNLRKGAGGKTFPVLDDVNSSTPLRGAGLGTIVKLKGATHEGGGNVFQAVKAALAVTKNRVLAWEGPVECTAGNIAASGNGGLINTGYILIDSVAAFASNGARGGLVAVQSATDVWLWFPIFKSTATELYIGQRMVTQAQGAATGDNPPWDADVLPANIAHDDKVYVVRPYHVVPMGTSGATGQAGIAHCNLSAGYYGFIQKTGAGLIQATGALAAGSLSGNLAADGQAATAETGTLNSGIDVTVLKATSGAGAAPIVMNFPLGA